MSLWNCPICEQLYGPCPGNLCPKCGRPLHWTTVLSAPSAPRALPPVYQDAGLPLGTEVYGFLEALDVDWSTDEVNALEHFIQGRIDAAVLTALKGLGAYTLGAYTAPSVQAPSPPPLRYIMQTADRISEACEFRTSDLPALAQCVSALCRTLMVEASGPSGEKEKP